MNSLSGIPGVYRVIKRSVSGSTSSSKPRPKSEMFTTSTASKPVIENEKLDTNGHRPSLSPRHPSPCSSSASTVFTGTGNGESSTSLLINNSSKNGSSSTNSVVKRRGKTGNHELKSRYRHSTIEVS